MEFKNEDLLSVDCSQSLKVENIKYCCWNGPVGLFTHYVFIHCNVCTGSCGSSSSTTVVVEVVVPVVILILVVVVVTAIILVKSKLLYSGDNVVFKFLN